MTGFEFNKFKIASDIKNAIALANNAGRKTVSSRSCLKGTSAAKTVPPNDGGG